MSFLVSPGVEVKETDLTNVIPAVSTSIGGYVGQFAWGPVDQIVTVSSEKELASIFGKPDDNTATHFFTAASFLKYGSALKVVRQVDVAKNAVSEGAAALYKTVEEFEAGAASFAARYPGALGNSLKVYLFKKNTLSSVEFYSVFDNYSNMTFDEVHVLVVDELGLITGSPKTILEKYEYLSRFNPLAKTEDGSSAYIDTVLNEQSSYIYSNFGTVLDDSQYDSQTDSAFTAALSNYTLSGGVDDTTVVIDDYSAFEDAETVDLNLLIGGACDNTKAAAVIALAASRKDVVAFVSPVTSLTVNIPGTTATTNVKTFFDGLTSTSYAVFDSTALYIYDKYNDVYRWIPASGHMAGLCARTDADAEPWFSPAGYNRGNLLGVTKIAFNPNQTQRDTLYKARINPIVSFPGQGILLFGDKTALSKPSAFDRINVRRLFIILEKAIATAAKYQLFELNDEFTRAMFRNMTEPFLRDVQGRRGITDFLVVCDETNNTGQVIDSNRFVADIYIKPARSINFITLNFIATRTGVEFSEIVGTV
jgi:phage tail sheath protein FI